MFSVTQTIAQRTGKHSPALHGGPEWCPGMILLRHQSDSAAISVCRARPAYYVESIAEHCRISVQMCSFLLREPEVALERRGCRTARVPAYFAIHETALELFRLLAAVRSAGVTARNRPRGHGFCPGAYSWTGT